MDGDSMSTGLGATRYIRNSIRYIALAVVILAAWNFFAPFLSAPSWAPYLDILPVVIGRTEANGYINATHVGVFAIAAVVVLKL
jgi:hypothetical protein